jgi:hypothetical protein
LLNCSLFPRPLAPSASPRRSAPLFSLTSQPLLTMAYDEIPYTNHTSLISSALSYCDASPPYIDVDESLLFWLDSFEAVPPTDYAGSDPEFNVTHPPASEAAKNTQNGLKDPFRCPESSAKYLRVPPSLAVTDAREKDRQGTHTE